QDGDVTGREARPRAREAGALRARAQGPCVVHRLRAGLQSGDRGRGARGARRRARRHRGGADRAAGHRQVLRRRGRRRRDDEANGLGGVLMRQFDRRLAYHFDWLTVLLTLAVASLGLITIYSATVAV